MKKMYQTVTEARRAADAYEAAHTLDGWLPEEHEMVIVRGDGGRYDYMHRVWAEQDGYTIVERRGE